MKTSATSRLCTKLLDPRVFEKLMGVWSVFIIMIKTFIVDKTDVNMRIDRLLRSKLGKIPQSLIEKSLRNGN